MTGKGSDISGKGGAAMSMWLKLNAIETGTKIGLLQDDSFNHQKDDSVWSTYDRHSK